MRAAFAIIVVMFIGCEVGDSASVEPSAPDARQRPAPDALPPTPILPTARLEITATSTRKGGNYAPQNVVAVWVETEAGAFVRTIAQWSQDRTEHLRAWIAKAGLNDTDAISGPTRINHATPLSIEWNLKNRLNQTVPDGSYVVRMELADRNSTVPDQNHQATFTFTKGAEPQTQTGLGNNGFTNVSIRFTPAPAAP